MLLPPAETYKTVRERSESTLREKASRFIGRAFPVQDEKAVQAVLAQLRKEEWDATHHCSAYRLGLSPVRTRADDDGEPSGTAGIPLLRALESFDVTNTLLVVTRYYGGTKLGTGGLIRAYGEVGKQALEGAVLTIHRVENYLRIGFAYADTSPAMHLIDRFEARIMATRYDTHTEIDLAIPPSRMTLFKEAFRESTGGRGWVNPL